MTTSILSNPWMALGDLVLELGEAPEELQATFGFDYAEHPAILGKARLQYMGPKLRELKYRLYLHWQYCNPEEMLAALLELGEAAKPLDIMLGSGEYGRPFAGKYVLTDLPVVLKEQADNGRPLLIEVDVTLREWVEDVEVSFKPATGKAIKKGSPHVKRSEPAPFEDKRNKDGYSVKVPVAPAAPPKGK